MTGQGRVQRWEGGACSRRQQAVSWMVRGLWLGGGRGCGDPRGDGMWRPYRGDSVGNSRRGGGSTCPRAAEARALWPDWCFKRNAGQPLPPQSMDSDSKRVKGRGPGNLPGDELHQWLWSRPLCLPRKPEQWSVYFHFAVSFNVAFYGFCNHKKYPNTSKEVVISRDRIRDFHSLSCMSVLKLLSFKRFGPTSVFFFPSHFVLWL